MLMARLINLIGHERRVESELEEQAMARRALEAGPRGSEETLRASVSGKSLKEEEGA